MPFAGKILSDKGRDVHTVAPGATTLEAAQLMDKFGIGALVVLDGQSVVGIFTERDLMRRVVVPERDTSSVIVSAVMTGKVYCCSSDTSTDELRVLMREKRIRHVPVVDDGQLVGMLSIGDLNVARDRTQEETIQYLEQFMYTP